MVISEHASEHRLYDSESYTHPYGTAKTRPASQTAGCLTVARVLQVERKKSPVMVLGETGSRKRTSLNAQRVRKQGVLRISSGRKTTSSIRRAANMNASSQTIRIQVEL